MDTELVKYIDHHLCTYNCPIVINETDKEMMFFEAISGYVVSNLYIIRRDAIEIDKKREFINGKEMGQK